METFKKICKALLYPHTAVIICLIPVSAVLLLISFFKFDTEHPVSYVSYVLSAYTLTVVCMKIPKFVKYFKRVKNENEYVARYRSDAQLRVKISLYISVFINSFYAVFQLGLGLTHDSFWFYSLSASCFFVCSSCFPPPPPWYNQCYSSLPANTSDSYRKTLLHQIFFQFLSCAHQL